jgi:hypothetical protein
MPPPVVVYGAVFVAQAAGVGGVGLTVCGAGACVVDEAPVIHHSVQGPFPGSGVHALPVLFVICSNTLLLLRV